MKLYRIPFLLVSLAPAAAGFGGCGSASAPGFSTSGGGAYASVSSSSGAGGGFFTTGTGGATPARLVAACTADAECGTGLFCLHPADQDPVFGGGAPGGFCTAMCTAETDCTQDGSACYRPDPSQPGRCTLSCVFGPPITGVQGLFTTLSSTKCLGRDEVRCGKAQDGSGACLPTCGSDAQCPDGRCDPRTAVCVTTPSNGLPTGSACNLSQVPTACAGLCVGFTTAVAMCSEPCVLGNASSQSVECGGAGSGFCAWHPSTNGLGDTGFCTPACAQQSDCQTPSFWCFGVPQLTEVVHKGYCFAATPCPHGPSDCLPTVDGGTGDAGSNDAGASDAGASDAGASDAGANDAGYTCTMTAAGPFCLDPAFPVDLDAGAGEAGSGDGGDGG